MTSGRIPGCCISPGAVVIGLEEWGWDKAWAELFADFEGSGEPARVSAHHRDRWEIQTQSGARDARSTGSLTGGLRPSVGDWVVASPGPTESDPWQVDAVLPRRSCFSRGSALDGSEEQVLASNVERAWILHGLDTPLNARRLERYLAVAWESGALPEFVLTKSDLAEDAEAAVALVETVGIGTQVWVVGMHDDESIGVDWTNVFPAKSTCDISWGEFPKSKPSGRLPATSPIR